MNRSDLPALTLILISSAIALFVFWAWQDSSSPNPASNRVLAAEQKPPVADTVAAISSADFEVVSPQSEKAHGFVEMDPAESGIDLVHVWDPPQVHRNLVNPVFGTGAAIGDYDGDGWQDVFVGRQTDAGRLYRNLGGMKFEDVTEKVGIDPTGMWTTGTTFVDVNNDGRLDLYLCGFDCPNRLYINDGSRFTERAAEYGLNFRGASVVMTFSDYDHDGDLDAYLVTNYLQPAKLVNPKVMKRPGMPPEVAPENREDIFLTPHPDGSYVKNRAGQFDHLYQNQNGKFVEVTGESGIGWQPYMGHSATWWDYNNDGWPDLYVANDYMGPDFHYRNNGPGPDGTVTFTNVIEEAMPHTPWYSMGSDFADINNDGRLDYMASDMAGTTHYRDKLSMGNMSGPDSDAWFLNWSKPPQYMRNAVYLNTGTAHFMEIAFLAGLAKTDWTWATRFADFDNDGWQDLFCTNGMTRDLFNSDYRDQLKKIREDHLASGSSLPLDDLVHEFWESKEPYRLENLAFQNTGHLKFENVAHKWGLDHLGVSTGAATGDLDNDGDLDLVVTGFEEPVRVYRNDLADGHSIRFRLVGRTSNRNGLGTWVEIREGEGQVQAEYLSPTRGFMSTSEPVVHFGVGELEKISKVIVHWPSGIEQEFENLATGKTYTISEATMDASGLTKGRGPQAGPAMFERDSSLEKIAHHEIEYDDFQREPLLPNKSSQSGPGVAWGDIDGDGDDDLYVSGSAAFPGQLVENRGSAGFFIRTDAFDGTDAASEDMGALFFDADGDRDADLYVVSGSVECQPGAESLQDRLYLNDGKGAFQKSDVLPDMRFSGGCVNACDFDRDGKLDLFVGGRVIPGAWPETPRSALLHNRGGRFDDVTESVAPGLAHCGMVTSAIWSDVDNDNWPDLLVTIEWGPVRFFKNESGTLIEQTAPAALAERVGWYNSICGGDVDNDGDTDFVVGNWGLNSKYKASPEIPALIFYGDFEGLGRKQIVEAKFENGVCLPGRGLSCSSHAMPMIREKLPTFHQFATADLFDIYSHEKLDDATRYEANSLKSGVLLNESADGQVRFRFVPLPVLAQASPIFGCILSDVDGDGFLDLYVVQNFFGPQVESGYLDGGVSLLMRGTGTGQFVPVPPCESGLMVTKDATSLTATDLNGDGRIDFVVGKNNQPLEAFLNRQTNPSKAVRVAGLEEGRQVIGAKLYLELPDGSVRLHEVTAGDGYLSQSPPLVFGDVTVRNIVWPGPVQVATQSDEGVER